MTTTMNQKQLEEFAFYESGLSADRCLQKLDSYTIEAIGRYGKILVEKQKVNQKLEEIARRLYGVVLHLNAVTENKPIMVVGLGLYNETLNAIKMYEDYNPNT